MKAYSLFTKKHQAGIENIILRKEGSENRKELILFLQTLIT